MTSHPFSTLRKQSLMASRIQSRSEPTASANRSARPGAATAPAVLSSRTGRAKAAKTPKAKKRQSKCPGLCVETSGTRHFISVPVGLSMELHNYLRSNRVRSAPPEPAFTGLDSIELAKDIDVDALQALLNAWQ